ncbi:hypothetical protein SERLA73DRAFT_157458 [Serpula lacrymans var. lacrymans S7.3]|uniref:Uncharacterized protein n=1 Tax=Serpula lacrymans var. lacrymans (strain S7.3) TaxID=936435 RepID=F8QJ45_SERL3|nr:hypothetical protein SERLA73DRAFT_157458 [Serpula lacrymans var. lacrymans S7.3]
MPKHGKYQMEKQRYELDLPEDDPLEPPSDDELGVEGVYEDDQQANSEAEDGGEEKPLVLKGINGLPVSEIAAQSSNLAKTSGGRAIRQWANAWIKTEDLPTSQRGRHVKVSSLLDDPKIAAECRSYLQSNKWATNPQKFSKFVNQTMLPVEGEKYAKHIVDKEMPQGMKCYLELCVPVCARGFHYMQYKKAVYFDGHKCPNVVQYWQDEFLPEMAKHCIWLVEYKVGNIGEEIRKILPRGTKKLVLLAHDESTMQANDGPKAGWGPNGGQPLLKKGVGRGSHWSNVISSIVSWLKNAGQQLEYGNNYDGYWTGELFVKQLKDALWVQTINLNPGGRCHACEMVIGSCSQ